MANDLKVLHYPQVPCKPFEVFVNSEKEAYLVQNVLANQHLWLYNNGFIPDYSNAIVVMSMDEDGEYSDYFNEEEMLDWDEYCEKYFQ